jgi:membrane protein
MLKLKEVLSTQYAELGKASRFLVFQIKLWSHCARLLKKNRAGQQAAALSYHTIFGVVPLAIVVLLIFQSFPAYSDIGEKVKNLIYEGFNLTTIEISTAGTEGTEKTEMLTEYLDGIVGRFFAGVNKGSITLISVPILIWAALALLSTIERAFNNIWRVGRGRNFVQRMINYWALLTLGPLLIGVYLCIGMQYSAVGHIHKTILSNVAPALLSYLIWTAAFFFLYFVLPNTKVQARAAIWGAAVAALVWSFAKWGFAQYVTEFVPYSRVYGVVGLVPLGVFSIYITWLIVLFGLQLTFTTQHLKSLDAAEIAAAKKSEDYFIANDFTAINIMREIAVAFEANNAPVSSQVICSSLGMPAEFGEKMLEHLVAKGLLMKTSEPKVGFVPSKDPDDIKLSDIVVAVAEVGFAQSTTEQPASLMQIARSQTSALEQYSLKQILTSEGEAKIS